MNGTLSLIPQASDMIRKSKTISLWIFYLLLGIYSFNVCAQHPINTESIRSPFRGKNFISPMQERVLQLQYRTTKEYLDKMYGVQSRLPSTDRTALRTQMDDCAGTYLCPSAALPVSLLYFNGERLNAEHVKLTWETSSEVNNSGFEIERSFDTPLVFENIGFVDGVGKSSDRKSYDFEDINFNQERTYYRLKQLDYDGTFEYSRIISVVGITEELTITPMPNPGPQNNTAFLVTGYDATQLVALTVINTSGVIIYKNSNFEMNNEGIIKLSKLPKLLRGLYIAKIISGDKQSTASFVISD